MLCNEVRQSLVGFSYGELKPVETAAIEEHLTNCSACRTELASWQRLKGLLNQLPAPAVQVDLATLYREAAHRQQRRLRRWRRAALGLVGVAAALLIALSLKLEIRCAGQQLVVRWGNPPPMALDQQPPSRLVERPSVNEADLQLVKDLIHALAADVESRDRQHQETLISLQTQLTDLDRQTQDLWGVAVRYVAALQLTRKETQEKE